VERGLIDVDDIGGWLGHQNLCNALGELLLGMQQLDFPFCLGAIDNLRLPIRCSMLNVYLSN
jgi:hypothetical protein